jgi:hypothetical protein
LLALFLSASFISIYYTGHAQAVTSIDVPTAGVISDEQIAGYAADYCTGDVIKEKSFKGSGEAYAHPKAACETGFTAGFKQSPGKTETCGDEKSASNGEGDKKICEAAYDYGASVGPQLRDVATSSQIQSYSDDYCSGDALSKNAGRYNSVAYKHPKAACEKGYTAGFTASGSKSSTCNGEASAPNGEGDKKICEAAYDTGKAKGSAVDTSRLGNPAATSSASTDATSDDSHADCDASGFNLSWILCPIIDGLVSAVDGIYGNIIEPLLITQPIAINDPSGDPTHAFEIWSNYRIFGNIFLVIALLVVVFGQGVGGGLIEAYTVKKVLPRLLIAAVLINLSIYIVAFAVDVANIVGNGIAALIEAPFRSAGAFKLHLGVASSGAGTTALIGGALGTAIWAYGFTAGFLEFLFLGILVPTFLFFIAILVTLLIRNGLILFLVMTSPIAFALYCLPNTEKYFRQWWSTLVRTLMMYPIIAVIFAIANVLSVTIASTTTGLASGLAQLLSIAALIIPLFLIPFSYRIAGGVMGQVGNFVNDRKNRIAQPIGQFRKKRMQQHRAEMWEKTQSSEYFRKAQPGTRQEAFNKRLGKISNIGAIGASGMSRTAMKADIEAAATLKQGIAQRKAAEHSQAFAQFIQPNDTMNAAAIALHLEGVAGARAALKNGGVKTVEEQDQALAILRRAQIDLGAQNLAYSSAIAMPATGTGDPEGPAQTYANLAKVTDGNTVLMGAGYAQARGGMEKARRYDMLEGFGGGLGHMDEIVKVLQNIPATATPEEREATLKVHLDRINSEAADNALEVQGIQAVLSARGNAAKNFVPAIQRRIQRSLEAVRATENGGTYDIREFNEGTQKWETKSVNHEGAIREMLQSYAMTSVLNDNAASASPEIQRLMADTVHNMTLDLSKELPTDVREMLTGNPEGITEVNGQQVSVVTNQTLYRMMERFEAFRQTKKVWGDGIDPRVRGGINPEEMGPQPPQG